MSWVYFRFLFVNTIKRKSVWITWLLFLFTCSCFLLILPAVANINTLQVWSNTIMAVCQTFIGMIAALFTAVLAINVFKDSNEEGTELIVISKPISRLKIVITKFWLFGLFCLMVNISSVLLTSFTIFLPRTEIVFYGGLLISMFIGNLVTFAIFGSIAILLSAKFVKVGIIVVNLVISLVFLIYQVLTLFVFSTPPIILDRNGMSAATYILHNRNTETGDYVEEEMVKFSPFTVNDETLETKTTCKAKNWQEMKNFWEVTIKSQDATPVLNATDFAGQISLTYLSYKTNEFAFRQSKRMFGLSRFYNYVLTDPASPEITDNPNKKTLDWMYTSYYDIEVPVVGAEPFHIYFPARFGFAGIPPLTMTKLRGYADKIPVGTVKSKEFSWSREVFFEKDEWQRYKPAFDTFYEAIFDYRNYSDLVPEEIFDVIEDRPSIFAANNDTIKRYYDIAWGCLTQDQDIVTKCKMNIDVYNQWLKEKSFNLDIHDIHDLNNRFIQFKNYVYWKALDIQKSIIHGDVDTSTDFEAEARAEAITRLNRSYKAFDEATGIGELLKYHFGSATPENESNDGWMMCGLDPNGIIGTTKIPSTDIMSESCRIEKSKISSLPEEQQTKLIMNCAAAKFEKSIALFNRVVDPSEAYLYSSLSNSSRSSNNSGEAYSVTDTWLPNLNGYLGTLLQLNTPLGQNIQYFFYDAYPTINYWMFAIIWGCISVGLLIAGAVVYNKYDIK